MSKVIQRHLHEHGYQVISQGTEGSLALWNQHLRRFIEDGVDGLVIVPADSDKPEREQVLWQLKLSRIPFVYLNTAFKRVPSDHVVVDLGKAVSLAAGHLLELGHRHIGCISAEPFRKETRFKIEVLRARLAEAGVELREDEVCVGASKHDEGGHEAALRLLDRPRRPTALFATNDIIAMGAIHAARELGIAVPGDLSIIGLDNIEFGRLSVPRLSTVGHPVEEMATRAAGILLQRIAGQLDPDFVEEVVEPELVVRDSTRAPG
jgi:LacI family transcriptional regulator